MSAMDSDAAENVLLQEMDSAASSPLSEWDDDETLPPFLNHAAPARRVKVEEESEEHTTATTLRPAPPPSKKRRESEVSADAMERARHSHKRRKRESSPPWTFPTAESTTLKTADGRRISARVNAGTPALSDHTDPRARSSSLSAPPARSRPQSPPWKKFEPQAPTRFMVDGQRKSGRVNKEMPEPESEREAKSAPRPQPPPAKRVSPRSKEKEQRVREEQRAAVKQTPAKSSVNGVTRTTPARKAENSHRKAENSHRKSAEHEATSKIAALRAQIDALRPTRSFPSPKIRLRLHHTPRQPIPPPHPNAKFPPAVYPPRLSIFQTIEAFELKELQQPYTENERGPPDMTWFLQRAEKQAQEEGAMRRRILTEAEAGGMLSKEKLSIYQNVEQQPEPPKQYAHHDHLVAHALHLRHLQLREKTAHKQLARKVAHEALDFWKAKRGPSEEEIREEQDKVFRLIQKQVVLDLRLKWDLVRQHVQANRLRMWEQQAEAERRRRLREKLEWSENLVARLRGEGSEMDEEGESEEDATEDESSGEENMSQSSSGEDEDEDDVGEAGAVEEMGEEDLKVYLALREAELRHGVEGVDDVEEADGGALQLEEDVSVAEMVDDHSDGPDVSMAKEEQESQAGDDGGGDLEAKDTNATNTIREASKMDVMQDEEEAEDGPDEEFQVNDPATGGDNATGDLEEYSIRRSRLSSAVPGQDIDTDADIADISDDHSTDMDSTDYDSDEEMSSSGEEEADSDDDGEEEVPKNSLLSLFKDEVREKAVGLPTPTTSAEGEERTMDEEAPPSAPTPDTTIPVTAPTSPAAAESTTAESSHDDPATKHLVPSPSLLRGTLRSYQHTGVDWLASLYRNGTNGILADEMGLGKTIQTIALLAHLAEEHAVWDAHLVIVPTSVVLNWVTEFNKFLPAFRVLGYYGTAEERQAKRRGWVNDPHHDQRDKRGYNVVITSYNVAMQDINAIRNVHWHYLVLDEAHNIRNFNSQRWQVLIRLRTRARLLLTGTPLQNSLTELWSLLTFLTAGDDDPQHGDLEEFLSHWKEPVKEIFDRGVASLSSEAQKVVDQLHVSLRPFLLRRLKADVEKDLPKKTESVVVCKLSKRQRQLYQDYMGLADTRRRLTQGNAVSAGKVLLSLRRVCNHPDLFDPRPIQTSLAMEASIAEGFEGKEDVVRRLLGVGQDLSKLGSVTSLEVRRKSALVRARQLSDRAKMLERARELEAKALAHLDLPDASTLAGSRALQRLRIREKKLEHLRSCIRISEDSLQSLPIYGSDLREVLTIRHDRAYSMAIKDPRGRVTAKSLRGWPALGRFPLRFEMEHASDWLLAKDSMLQRSVQTTDSYAQRLHETLVRFAFVTPATTAPVLSAAIPARTQQLIRALETYPLEADPAHEARMRTSIVFPDSRLLIYDSGKLQNLTRLLRELQSRGSRSLIFTQMTGTLNILEQYLSLLNLPYLRLDGSTPVERRQLYSAEFNRPDSKFQCMILSSRAGGIGLNLIGASSVIFYDLDWNPQMDRQCMDRAHRIGQVRDVEVYKMVSEKTVEENILRRADQKSLLDRTVIQEGHFTTEAMERRAEVEDEEEGDGVAAAIERFLGSANNEKTSLAMDSVEDREDVLAAAQARKEERLDDADFAESKGPSMPHTPGVLRGEEGLQDEEGLHGGDGHGDDSRGGHVDGFMIRAMERWLVDVPFIPPAPPKRDRHGRDSHGRRRR